MFHKWYVLTSTTLYVRNMKFLFSNVYPHSVQPAYNLIVFSYKTLWRKVDLGEGEALVDLNLFESFRRPHHHTSALQLEIDLVHI